jgi:hypothetical protein
VAVCFVQPLLHALGRRQRDETGSGGEPGSSPVPHGNRKIPWTRAWRASSLGSRHPRRRCEAGVWRAGRGHGRPDGDRPIVGCDDVGPAQGAIGLAGVGVGSGVAGRPCCGVLRAGRLLSRRASPARARDCRRDGVGPACQAATRRRRALPARNGGRPARDLGGPAWCDLRCGGPGARPRAAVGRGGLRSAGVPPSGGCWS